jgi:thiamine-phosphate pyrophosphorylase
VKLDDARLYAITPDAEPDEIDRLAGAWLRGGVDVIQLRTKSLPRGILLQVAKRLASECRQAGTLCIVNDHLDVALLSGADGVHLGETDLSVEAARRLAGDRIIVGASASTPEAGERAERAGADYLGTGPAFATPIKAEKPAIGPDGVAAVQGRVRIPVFAIGGIERANVPELLAAGVTRICVIRALSGAPDPEEEARRLRQALAVGARG